MLELQLEKASTFKKIIDSIKDIVVEAPLICQENSISMDSTDPAKVVLVSLKLSTTFFKAYRCDRTVSLGLNMINVSNAIKCGDNDDVCHIKFGGTSQDVVTFAFHDACKTKIQKITLKQMNIVPEINIPDHTYSVTIEMDSAEFSKLIHDVAQFTASLKISASKEGIEFFGSGDKGEIIVLYNGEIDPLTQNSRLIFELNESVTSSFSIKYMLMFTKASGISDRVRFSISKDHPMVVEFKINEDSGYLRFYLAPQIDVDDDMF